MKEKITLFELLKGERKKFNLSKKLKIYSISSTSLIDRLRADIEEYFIDDIPYHLLKKEVAVVYFFENAIEVFKEVKK